MITSVYAVAVAGLVYAAFENCSNEMFRYMLKLYHNKTS